MANALFQKGKQGLLDGSIDLDTATIKVALVRGYTPNISTSTDTFVSDAVTAGANLVATATLGSKSVTNGVFSADATTTFPAVATGAAITRILVFQSSAVGGGADVATSSQRLIALIDTSAAGAISITPTGVDIVVTWDTGANKIFRI